MKYKIVGKYFTDVGVAQDELGPIADIVGNSDDGYMVKTGYYKKGPFRRKKDAWNYLCKFEEGII
jgi:hypothetical protein